MPAMFAGSLTAIPSPPTTGRHRSSSLRAAESSTGSPNAGTVSSTTRCTWPPSPRSAILGPWTHLLRAKGRRGQDQEGSPPLAQAPDQQRRLPTAPPRRPIGGPGGHSGTTRCLRDRLFTLHDRFFGEVTPEPKETLRRRVLPRRLDSSRLDAAEIGVLTQRGFVDGRMQLWQARDVGRVAGHRH